MESDDLLRAELKKTSVECERLRKENARLRLRLGEQPELPLSPDHSTSHPNIFAVTLRTDVSNESSPDIKVALFRSLFRGREDVYAVQWEGRGGRTGYSPAGIRVREDAGASSRQRKPVRHSKLFPLTDEVIRDHLLGKVTAGIYPLLEDDRCSFVAVDFDKKSWQTDASAFMGMCRETGVPASLERSQSGNGAHVWIFFADPVQASIARKLASGLLTRTMERRYAIGLDSYDRVIPSQDTMPKGGFGNLIALPLQRGPRENGNSVFLNDQLCPWDDQWAFLSSIKRLTPTEAQSLARVISGGTGAINVRRSISDDDETDDPWTLPPPPTLFDAMTKDRLPARVAITRANLVYVQTKDLPGALLNQLTRLAAFQNPEFYRAEQMRLSTFGKPRVIACAEILEHHVALPRGSFQEVLDLFTGQGVEPLVTDLRFGGEPFEAAFHGEDRPGQVAAAKALAKFDDGILCAPTALAKPLLPPD